MSTLFTAQELIELSLEKIGVYSRTDSGPESDDLEVGQRWLDLNLAQISGTHRLYFLTPDTLSVPLTAEVQEYDLATILGANTPEDGIQFVLSARLQDSGGNRTPLRLVRRKEFEDLDEPAQSGTPEWLYIDRLNDPTMKTWPTLGDGVTGYTVEIVVQTFAPSFGTDDPGQVTSLRAAWQRWGIFQLSADLGDGPLMRLPHSEIDRYRGVAETTLRDLLAFENTEHETEQPVAFYDGIG